MTFPTREFTFNMSAIKDPDSKQESLSASIKAITKTWEDIKTNSEVYREEIEKQYFRTNPMRMKLFVQRKDEEALSQDAIDQKLRKHSKVVVNCMETLIEFVNGNEDTKPIFFVLGRHHKLLNVNEKMFLEMKDAICKVIRRRIDAESSKAWDTVLQYIYINYIFAGMHKMESY